MTVHALQNHIFLIPLVIYIIYENKLGPDI